MLACSSFGAADAANAMEGGVTEGGATDGALPDGLATGGAAFCALHPGAVLCDDFDDPTHNPWRDQSVDDAGTLAVSAGDASPPNALHVTMANLSTAGSGCHDSYEMSGLLDVAAPKGFHLEFKVLLLVGPLTGNVVVGPGVTLLGGAEKCEYYADIGLKPSALYEEHVTTTTKKLDSMTVVKPGGWNTVSIDVAGTDTSRVVSLTINGTVAIDKKPVDLPCQTASKIDHLSVGLFCVERSLGADVDVRFDDVLLTVP